MIERTLLLIKPDGVERALIGKVISRLEDVGLKVVALKIVVPDRKLSEQHYIADKEWMENIGKKTSSAYNKTPYSTNEGDYASNRSESARLFNRLPIIWSCCSYCI